MKLIYIANARIPTEKAHGIQIMKMCEAFARQGVNVELVIPRRINWIKDNPFDFYKIKKNFSIIKLPVIDLISWGWIGFWWIEVLTFALSVSIFLFNKKKDDFIIYGRDPVSFFFLSKKFKIYFEAHDEMKDNFISRGLSKKIDRMISTNKFKRNKFIEVFGFPKEKTFVFPNGVEINDFNIKKTKEECRTELGLNVSGFLVGYVGQFFTVGEEKGLGILIDALAKLRNQYVSAAFIGGSEEDIEYYQLLAKEKGVADRCIFRGFQRRQNVPFYLKAFDALLMPFPKIRHYELAMSPLKMFEYMAAKRPIIASDLPSIREVLDESNSVLVEPNNPEALALGIKRVLQDDVFADKISERAFQDVQKYTWEKRAEKILKFINQE